MTDDFDRISKELEKLPTRKSRGHPDNLLRAFAGGFIFAGNDAETSIKKARALIKFWNWVSENLYKLMEGEVLKDDTKTNGKNNT